MNLKKKFNHIKIHTQYSICEGALKINELSEFCKEKKIEAVGISDSLNLCGALEFSQEISKSGTQPIIGTQINFSFSHNNLEKIGKISLIAKNSVGYKNLLKLSSNSYLSIEKNEDPHCSIEKLFQYSEGLIILIGGSRSLISSLILSGNSLEVSFLLQKIENIFKGNAYIEIQRHNEEHEKNLELKLLELSQKFTIPLIATHEVFYLTQDMHEAHDAYVCVGQKTYVNDPKRLKYSDQHYLKSHDEMALLFADLPEALENNYNLKLRCNFRPLSSKPMLPNFSTELSNVNDELKAEAEKGLKVKLKDFVLKNIADETQAKKITKEYEDRLNYEVLMISKIAWAAAASAGTASITLATTSLAIFSLARATPKTNSSCLLIILFS